MNRMPLSGLSALVLTLLTLACLPLARAQAIDTAHKTISTEFFGMATVERPEFGDHDLAWGFSGGGSMDWRFRRFRPGVMVRGSVTTYSFMTMKEIGAGPKLTFDAGRWHPYADFLYGYGAGTFAHTLGSNYNGNNSSVVSYGGGVDYSLTRTWAIRLDYQHEHWDFDAPYTPFYPQPVSLGVRYMPHFRSRNGPR